MLNSSWMAVWKDGKLDAAQAFNRIRNGCQFVAGITVHITVTGEMLRRSERTLGLDTVNHSGYQTSGIVRFFAKRADTDNGGLLIDIHIADGA